MRRAPQGAVFFWLLFFCARKKKVTKKKRRPAGLFASLATLLELPSSAPISEGRGTLCKTWNVSAMPFEATSKNTPHLQPSWSHSKQPRKIPFTRNPLGAFLTCLHQRGSRNVVRSLERVSTAFCIQPRVFDTRLSNRPRANFALLYVNPRVDKKQRKIDTSTALYSRLLKAGGWPQKLLLTRSKFCTVFRDPR